MQLFSINDIFMNPSLKFYVRFHEPLIANCHRQNAHFRTDCDSTKLELKSRVEK